MDDAMGVSKLICCFNPPIFGSGLEGAEGAKGSEGVGQLAGGMPLFPMDSLVFAIVDY